MMVKREFNIEGDVLIEKGKPSWASSSCKVMYRTIVVRCIPCGHKLLRNPSQMAKVKKFVRCEFCEAGE